MLVLFCLRLAFGLLAALVLLIASPLNPRFYRTHFLTVLGLGAIALVLPGEMTGLLRGVLLATLALALLGSVSWSLEGHPGGRSLLVLTLLGFGAALWLAERQGMRRIAPALETRAGLWLAAENLSSAALLGVALTAMLVGHSYLLAPSMSLTPLRRMLGGLFAALLARAAVAATALAFWTADHSLANLTDVAVLWLPLRWGLGFVLPAVLSGMAWQTARLRNTQSATGILYIVVVFCFLGELTGQLLFNTTGYFL